MTRIRDSQDLAREMKQLDQRKMLDVAKNLREVIRSIRSLLDEYEGIEGNKGYVSYCLNKTKRATINDLLLKQFLEDAYAVPITDRKPVDLFSLANMIIRQWTILDDIDTASDIFKPIWCNITTAVNLLQKHRWLYKDQYIHINKYLEENDKNYKTTIQNLQC